MKKKLMKRKVFHKKKGFNQILSKKKEKSSVKSRSARSATGSAAPVVRESVSTIKPQSQAQPQSRSQAQPQSQSQAQPQSQSQEQPQSQSETKPKNQSNQIDKGDIDEMDVDTEDYTEIPNELDRKFEVLDEDSALRPTIIQPGTIWTKSSQAALLAPPTQETLDVPKQEIERNKAFDLLDALSRSGCLDIDQASLHVVMAATHCFDKTLIDTVIQDNVNPIEKVERSALILATTIHNKPAVELVKLEQYERVSTFSPVLFGLPPVKKGHALTYEKK